MLKINYTIGMAGTGKSTELIKKAKLLPPETSVIIAPTHKALHRLQQYLPNNIEVKTIHSLLGWIPTINENAKHINHIDSTAKLDKPLEEYTHIVIDEMGMMSEEMFLDIVGKVEEYSVFAESTEIDVEIHCFGDPYQLLPVKGQQIQTDPTTTVELTTQHRSESPDIVALFTKMVNYLKGTNTSDLSTPYSEHVKPFDINKFKEGDRLLAYTNKAVGEWNQKIAKQLGIKSYIGQEVQLGNMLDTIVCDEFIKPSLEDLLAWRELGILVLQNNQINKKFLEASLHALIKNKNIEFIVSEDKVYPVIVGIGKANLVIKQTKEKAIKERKNYKDVYALNRAFIMDYSFASTVHKSQGNEWNTIFIDKKDIQKSVLNNTYYMTYARMLYVSISRARHIIYI